MRGLVKAFRSWVARGSRRTAGTRISAAPFHTPDSSPPASIVDAPILPGPKSTSDTPPEKKRPLKALESDLPVEAMSEETISRLKVARIESTVDLWILSALAIGQRHGGAADLAKSFAEDLQRHTRPFEPLKAEARLSIEVDELASSGGSDSQPSRCRLASIFSWGGMNLKVEGGILVGPAIELLPDDISDASALVLAAEPLSAKVTLQPGFPNWEQALKPSTSPLLSKTLERVTSKQKGQKFSPRTRAIVERRFGLKSGAVETLEQIGAELGVTRARIQQIEGRGISWLLEHPSAGQQSYRDWVLSRAAAAGGAIGGPEIAALTAKYVDLEGYDASMVTAFLCRTAGVPMDRVRSRGDLWAVYASDRAKENRQQTPVTKPKRAINWEIVSEAIREIGKPAHFSEVAEHMRKRRSNSPRHRM